MQVKKGNAQSTLSAKPREPVKQDLKVQLRVIKTAISKQPPSMRATLAGKFTRELNTLSDA